MANPALYIVRDSFFTVPMVPSQRYTAHANDYVRRRHGLVLVASTVVVLALGCRPHDALVGAQNPDNDPGKEGGNVGVEGTQGGSSPGKLGGSPQGNMTGEGGPTGGSGGTSPMLTGGSSSIGGSSAGGTTPIAVGGTAVEGDAGAPNGVDANAPLSFAAPMTYAGGAWAMDIGVADLNGDGALDVASADFSHPSAGAFVWLNRGDGTFRAASPYHPGGHAVAIAIGDFNGDAKPELVLAGEDDLNLLLNHGDGTFSAPSQLATGGSGVRALDANGDGKLDILTPTSLFLNQGGALFSASAVAPGRPWVAADLNADGKTDVVGAGGSVFVSLGTGEGSFAPRLAYASGASARGSSVRGSAVGDVNRDGWPDLAAANDNDASASVLLNQGDGTFSAARVYPTGRWPTSVALGDLNGDGWPELVVANSGYGNSDIERSHYLGVHRNRGDGTFETPEEFLLVEYPYSLALADLDGDDKLDIVVGNGGGNLNVVLNTSR